jgi:hypothetical protein
VSESPKSEPVDPHDARFYKPGDRKWDLLTPMQYALLLRAHDEGFLFQVMSDWRARQRWFETGSTMTPSDLTDDDKRELIPQFAEIVSDAVDRRLIELHEYEDEAKGEPAGSLGGVDLQAVLADPASWIWRADLDFRLIHIDTTDLWDNAKDTLP